MNWYMSIYQSHILGRFKFFFVAVAVALVSAGCSETPDFVDESCREGLFLAVPSTFGRAVQWCLLGVFLGWIFGWIASARRRNALRSWSLVQSVRPPRLLNGALDWLFVFVLPVLLTLFVYLMLSASDCPILDRNGATLGWFLGLAACLGGVFWIPYLKWGMEHKRKPKAK